MLVNFRSAWFPTAGDVWGLTTTHCSREVVWLGGMFAGDIDKLYKVYRECSGRLSQHKKKHKKTTLSVVVNQQPFGVSPPVYFRAFFVTASLRTVSSWGLNHGSNQPSVPPPFPPPVQ